MKRAYIILVISLVALSLASTQAFAQQESFENSTEVPVAQRCALAQNYLKNIQKPRDLRARVDRLQAYRYIYQRMNVFVLRLERNNQPEATNLRASLTRLNESIEQFKKDYETYDLSREAVVKQKDCANDFNTFNSNLTKMREERARVSQNVELIQSILGTNITTQLDTLYQQLLISGKSGALNE